MEVFKMAFQVDMSPLTRSSMNIGSALSGIGQAIGQGIQQRQLKADQEQEQGDIEAFMRQAISGDPIALEELMVKSPQAAQQVAQYLQQQMAGEQAETDRFQGEIANNTADFIEQMHTAPLEQQESMFNAAIDDPRYDIDEEDRGLFMDTNARKAIIGKIKGKDYAENFFGESTGKKPSFAPQVSALQTDPETGKKYVVITDRNSGEVKRVDAKNAIGETLEQEQDREFRSESLKDARQISKDSFSELKNIKSSIGTINEAIAAIDKGAESGIVDKYLPSFTESTIALENAAQRMGLDVISATTFGALSEGELRLAMDTAMPGNLQPKELRRWLVDRRAAKRKLANELSKMAIKLGKGKTTIAEYLEGNATFDYGGKGDLSKDKGINAITSKYQIEEVD